MGTRIQSLANNFTTTGIVKAAAINDTTVSGITSLPSGIGGALTLIKSVTASSSASIEFINGTNGVVLDGTYSSYVFSFTDIHPSNNSATLEFNLSTDSGSNYNVTKTSTYFRAYNYEDDGGAELVYITGRDLAQSTAYQHILNEISNQDKSSGCGYMYLYNPSSTTFVKHFTSTTNIRYSNSGFTSFFSSNNYIAGYGNTTSAINAVQFKFDSGNIDDGIIKLYGVS